MRGAPLLRINQKFFAAAVHRDGTATVLHLPRYSFTVGDRAPNNSWIAGWFYAGLSEDPQSFRYGKPLWVAPRGEGIMSWNEAAQKAAMRAQGCPRRTRLATPGEMDQIIRLIVDKGVYLGEFNRGAADNPASWEWTDWHREGGGVAVAKCRHFPDGVGTLISQTQPSSAHFVC